MKTSVKFELYNMMRSRERRLAKGTLTTTLILYHQNQKSSSSEEFKEPSWVDLSPNFKLSSLSDGLRLIHLLTHVKYYVCMQCVSKVMEGVP